MKTVNLRLRAAASLGFIALALGGCASMNESECRAVDWRMIGYEDGVAGHAGDRVAVHRKACAKHGVVPDFERYQLGRQEGLREYCQPANGFRVGARGAQYQGVCPADLEAGFAAAHRSGARLHLLESRLAQADRALHASLRELDTLEDLMLQNSLVIVSSESTAEERAQALLDTRRMAEDSGRLKAEIDQLESDRLVFEQDLEAYRATLADGV